MNNIDKIKALLESCNIAYLQLLHSQGDNLMTLVQGDLLWLDDSFIKSLDHTSELIGWREWPELGIGDTVMTKHGEGVIETILLTGEYAVRLSNFDPEHFNFKRLPRHDIALLQRAEA